MSILVECPDCGKTLKAKDAHAGCVVNCPVCRERIRIPVVPTSPTPRPKTPAAPPIRPKKETPSVTLAPRDTGTAPTNSKFPGVDTEVGKPPRGGNKTPAETADSAPAKDGKPKHPIPPWGWAFAAGCGLMPVATFGGAIPGALGMGAAGACVGFARDSKRSTKTRLLICSGLLVAVWSYFIVIVVIPPAIRAARRTAATADRDKPRAQERSRSSKKSSRPSTKRGRTDHATLPVKTVSDGGTPVDLLQLIDVDRDRVRGEWKRTASGLQASRVAKLFVPCKPPKEYEIRLVAERTKGSADLILGLIAPNGIAFNACIDSWSGSASGIALIDGKDVNANDNPTRQNGPTLQNDRSYTIVYTVRKDRLSVTVNGDSLVDWKPDYQRVSRHGAWSMPRDDLLYIAINHSTYEITSMILTPL